MIAKLIPLTLVIGLMYKGATMSKDQFSYVKNYSKIVTTQSELKNLSKVIEMEMAESGSLPSVDEWPNVVHAQYEIKKRDPIVDIWGYYYGYYPENNIYTLASVGPDLVIGTGDDILYNSGNQSLQDAEQLAGADSGSIIDEE